jgi:hypothetical protein
MYVYIHIYIYVNIYIYIYIHKYIKVGSGSTFCDPKASYTGHNVWEGPNRGRQNRIGQNSCIFIAYVQTYHGSTTLKVYCDMCIHIYTHIYIYIYIYIYRNFLFGIDIALIIFGINPEDYPSMFLIKLCYIRYSDPHHLTLTPPLTLIPTTETQKGPLA